MKRIQYSMLLLLVTVFQLFAKAQIIYNSSHMEPKKLPHKPSEIYTGKDFIYEEPYKEPNIFQRFLSYIYHKVIDYINELFNFNLSTETPSGRKILWIILFIFLVIVFIIGLVFFYKKFTATLGRNDRDKISVEEVEKNIDSVNFDLLIANAIKEKNYRLATRFYYLNILKIMSDKELINYEYQKTNYEYFYEINNSELRKLFKDISLVFDYCWYGNHMTGESDFDSIKNKFIGVQQLVSKL